MTYDCSCTCADDVEQKVHQRKSQNEASKYEINAYLLIDAQREEHRVLNR